MQESEEGGEERRGREKEGDDQNDRKVGEEGEERERRRGSGYKISEERNGMRGRVVQA